MFQSRIVVFKEIYQDDQVLFQWFREGLIDEDWIVPDQLFTEQEHWDLLDQD